MRLRLARLTSTTESTRLSRARLGCVSGRQRDDPAENQENGACNGES